MQFIDIHGLRFGRLTVGDPVRGGREVKWRCRCDCGQEALVAGHLLRSGDTSSCGCVRRAVTAEQGKKNLKHGHSLGRRSPEYRSWTAMWDRCSNPAGGNWPGYGGRGITVTDRWKDFEVFLADMGARPAGTTLDRRDNSKGYEPDNCRWATADEQNGNRRTSLILEHGGRRQSLSAWAREVGLHKATISMRLRAGWSVEDALTRKRTA